MITVAAEPTATAWPCHWSRSEVKAKSVPKALVFALNELWPRRPSTAVLITVPPKQAKISTGTLATSETRTRRTYGCRPYSKWSIFQPGQAQAQG